MTISKKVCCAIVLALAVSISASAQKKASYNYAAQRLLIPAELGKAYLGMPLKAFGKEIDLTNAEVDDRFEAVSIQIPFVKGNVTEMVVKVHGVSDADKESMVYEAKAKKKYESGEEYEATVKRLRVDKIANSGFVYAIYVSFKKDFDQKAWVLKTYGNKGSVRRPDDQYHFSDIEWTKKSTDGLTWLIRSLHEGDNRSLQLLGRIPGTEWGVDGVR